MEVASEGEEGEDAGGIASQEHRQVLQERNGQGGSAEEGAKRPRAGSLRCYR